MGLSGQNRCARGFNKSSCADRGGEAIKDNTVVLGITGSIAAYKAAEIVRELIKQDLHVRVVMTKAATRFITPLTLETLTGDQVYTTIFGADAAKMAYLRLGHEADLVLVAPATATIIAKCACGLANDILAATVLAATCPVIFAPAMHSEMYLNQATQDNIAVLKRRGALFVGPEQGELADGEKGIGRLAEIKRIVEAVSDALRTTSELNGKKVVVTAGGTRESLDAVRFLGNFSSGKMGYALARESVARGAKTILISAPTSLAVPYGVESVSVTTAQEMRQAVLEHVAGADAVIMTAAVADFRPAALQQEKIKKQETLTLRLEQNPDILQELGTLKEKSKKKGTGRASARREAGKAPMLIGFSAESRNVVEDAKGKLKKKRLDLIVATDITAPGSGFGQEDLEFFLIDGEGQVQGFPLISKTEAARIIVSRIIAYLKKH